MPESRTENKTYYLSKKRPPAVINDWFSSMNYFNNYSLKENVSSKDYNTLFNPDFIHDPLLLHGIKSRSFIRWMPFGVPALPAHFSKFVLNKNIDSTMPYEDERLDELGVLTFTTSVLEEDVEIVGPLKLTFWAKTEFPMPLTDAIKQAMVNEINKYYNFNEDTILLLDHPMRKDVQWVIEINDVYPGGRAKNITSGWLSAWHRPYDPNESPDVKDHQIDPNYVAFDPFYVTPHKNPKPIEEGHIYPYVVEIWPTVNVFKAGHKIRISISGSDFPHFIPNFRTSTNTLIIDQDHPASLEFSVANKQDEGNTWKWIDNIFEYLHKPAEEVKSGSVTGSLSTAFAGHEDIKVANAIVSFEDSNLTATTDSKGQFKFKNVPSGKKKVLFTAPGLESMAMTINVPENEMLTLVNIPKMTTESVIQKQFSEK
ncbi:MAG: hypothetical protein OMM_05044 [Candidatus Magnetoglobus multicellularis str. Araruama]|uniref:Xaa-Pro dipeptidyl-peptidase C-terminal domain-containing protein n=1 Tax=Candidatus Magnetoglobus multicellularis str. Araruama TaxID=890399 RepID=A0A1V1NYG0_9BACT|nr:MAG: hypothetical protein OMM_05044 [Candidatus Magnetoglobus multicellularis str. Araruama]